MALGCSCERRCSEMKAKKKAYKPINKNTRKQLEAIGYGEPKKPKAKPRKKKR